MATFSLQSCKSIRSTTCHCMTDCFVYQAASLMSALGPRVIVPQSRALKHLYTRIRDRDTPCKDFVTYSDRLMRILVEEGIGALPSKPKTVITPTQAKYVGEEVDEQNICAVSIIRAGDSLLDAVRRVLPAVPVGKILIQRDESTEEKLPTLSYVKLPADIASRRVLLCDPMLATGGSAKAAIEVLGKAGVTPDRIVFVNVVSCPEGIAAVHSEYSEVTIVTGEVDAGLNEHKYIVPGLGDFGDRIFGTTG